MTSAGPWDQDDGLDRVVSWFEALPAMQERFAEAIRRAFDEVLDGQRTGRYAVEQLSKVEKTYIGTKIEIIVQDEFALARGRRMDYLIVDEEVDAKWSMRSGGWMIPTEAVGELCLCMTADDGNSTFSVGLARAQSSRLRTSQNKDSKRYFAIEALREMTWLALDAPLAENLLLHLEEETRTAILDFGLSGQRRVNELFRRVQRRIVRREVVLAVAQQDDGPKRVRDARKHLSSEGILILGHQKGHPQIATGLGLPVPNKGSWISCRVTPALLSDDETVAIGGQIWRLAGPGEPPIGAPGLY